MKELYLQGWGQAGKTGRLMCEPPPGESGSVKLGHTGEAQDWCQKGCRKRKRDVLGTPWLGVLRDAGDPGEVVFSPCSGRGWRIEAELTCALGPVRR